MDDTFITIVHIISVLPLVLHISLRDFTDYSPLLLGYIILWLLLLLLLLSSDCVQEKRRENELFPGWESLLCLSE